LIIDKRGEIKWKTNYVGIKKKDVVPMQVTRQHIKKVLQYMKIIYIEIDGRMKKMMKTILDWTIEIRLKKFYTQRLRYGISFDMHKM
jgi:hypothetical protein